MKRRQVLKTGVKGAAGVGLLGAATSSASGQSVDIPVENGVEVTYLDDTPNLPGYYYAGSFSQDDACFWGARACGISGGVSAVKSIARLKQVAAACGAGLGYCETIVSLERLYDREIRWLHVYGMRWYTAYFSYWTGPVDMPDWIVVPEFE